MNRNINLIITDADLSGMVSQYNTRGVKELHDIVKTMHNRENSICIMTFPGNVHPKPFDLFRMRNIYDGSRRTDTHFEFDIDYEGKCLGIVGVVHWPPNENSASDMDYFHQLLEGTFPKLDERAKGIKTDVLVDCTDHPLTHRMLWKLGYDVTRYEMFRKDWPERNAVYRGTIKV